MSATIYPEEREAGATADTGGIGGHPRGLTTLFFTELWERFSYYGMRAILVLYMVASPSEGGLGFDNAYATSTVYGTYTMSVYLTALPGGLIADRLLGARLAVLLGGIIIACGHFSMIFPSLPFFYMGLIFIACGTGLLKPNISALVGGLYRADDPRRDSGFSIFYMGINVGAVLAPLVCGYLAEGKGFKTFLASMGFNPLASWHWGFGAAGIGMTLGLVVFLLQRDRIAHIGERISQQKAREPDAPKRPLTREEWKRVTASFILFLFTILFWAAYEQKGGSLNIFTKNLVRREIFGWEYPASWMQSLTAFYVICLAPVFSIMWIRMGRRQPSSPAKFALGLLAIGLGYLLMIPASSLAGMGRVSPLWLVALYFMEVVGEMCLSPVGLSTVTKLAPLKLVGIMMGVWFLATSLGNKLAGYLGGFFDATRPDTLVRLYGGIALALIISAAILAMFTPKIRKLMGGVN